MRPSLLDRLYPPTCILCGAPGAEGRDLCPGCHEELPWNRHACARCALPFDGPVPPGALCGPCRKAPPPFDGCVAPLRYELQVPALVTSAKFRGKLNAARLLGQILAAALESASWDLPDALVPVPLHPKRLRARGYNQALEIARILGDDLGLPLETSLCQRVTATPPQAGLDERERHRNIRGAFAVRGPLAGARIAIVDDVVTTASTVIELSRVLRRAGAGSLLVLTVSRTP
ncbi:ComF family protein [Thiorhodococcus minor]|uniref:ComF family protein n=2 Tax=Thiorhodococcus minor TaxID=57489 RepID=A0A6M0JTL0_9GAMM|nr:ComF family protein [Thiorhodococcus minor]NEV60880.1 ComF family protein [Thiorhodococcus minor]